MIDQLTIRLKKNSFLTWKISKQKVWKFLLPILQTIANSTTILLKTQVVIKQKKSVVKTNISLIFILNTFTELESNYFAKAYGILCTFNIVPSYLMSPWSITYILYIWFNARFWLHLLDKKKISRSILSAYQMPVSDVI